MPKLDELGIEFNFSDNSNLKINYEDLGKVVLSQEKDDIYLFFINVGTNKHIASTHLNTTNNTDSEFYSNLLNRISGKNIPVIRDDKSIYKNHQRESYTPLSTISNKPSETRSSHDKLVSRLDELIKIFSAQELVYNNREKCNVDIALKGEVRKWPLAFGVFGGIISYIIVQSILFSLILFFVIIIIFSIYFMIKNDKEIDVLKQKVTEENVKLQKF
ncbi:MAG: hypothetical protein WCG21_01695 [Eubacteriales bacterium]